MKKLFLIFMVLLLAFTVGADQFTETFYRHLNGNRMYLGLTNLETLESAENVAYSYSAILAENGKINHHALSDFEFEQLCFNYNLEKVIMREILISYKVGKSPLEIFLLFNNSQKHREAMVDPEGEYIGAGYVVKNGIAYFTAYIIKFKE